MKRSIFRALCALALLGCGSTGQSEVTFPAVGESGAGASFAAGQWQVTLEAAEVGVGPVYFCATSAASSELCPVAVAELASAGTINLLGPPAQPLGTVRGVTGGVRSATLDYAISWFISQDHAQPIAGAPFGHSARFRGKATRGGDQVSFTADVDVEPTSRGALAVSGARLQAEIGGATSQLRVRFDPSVWWSNVDFDALLAQSGGNTVEIKRGTKAHDALVFAMTVTAVPQFQFQ